MIAEDRAGRPNDFVAPKASAPVPATPSDCPFCAGHENLTPNSVLEIPGGVAPWKVRVVANKFPAVTFDGQSFVAGSASALGSLAQMPSGSHEVFVESPRHIQDLTDLSQAELACVLRAYRSRLGAWSADDRVRHVSLFKNVGGAAGASLEHIHSQLVALPTIPPAVAAELRAGQDFFAANERCIFCELLSEELSHGERLVVADDSFVAFCAYAGRQPYETWILPRHHQASFELLTDAETELLAKMLQQVVGRLQTQLAPLSYNLLLHTAPCGQQGSPSYHWHFELVPRSTALAGFEWGTGMHINPLAPERAAASLRGER